LKFQIENPKNKQITMTEIQNPNKKTIAHAAQAPALRVEPVLNL